MPANPLIMSEREEIRAGIERGDPISAIATGLDRCGSTISREITRNGGKKRYRAHTAQQRADTERARPKTTVFEVTPALAEHVTERLRAKDSPMTIAKELDRGLYPEIDGRASHETIYGALYAHGRRGLAKDLHWGLHRKRRCRKHRRAQDAGEPHNKGPLGTYRKITERPKAAEDRSEVGHLEGDLITGAYNRSAIATLFDRASRHLWLAGLPFGHGAQATLGALVEQMERIPEEFRRSLTWDQGREMALHAGLTTLCNMPVFFADPHSPWQRPTNENGNGLLRRYVGKGTDLAVFGPQDLLEIETRINTMPRRVLNWQTAAEVYAAMTR